MKLFHVHTSYRGRYFDLKICAKSKKEVGEIFGFSTYFLNNYVHAGLPISKDEIFSGIVAKPYSYNAVELLGKSEMDYELAKRLIDEECDRRMQKIIK